MMLDRTDRLSGEWRPRRRSRSGEQRGLPAYLVPGSITAVRELAELIAAGEWAPSCYRGGDGRYMVDKIVLGIMHGAAVGLGPFAAIHAIAVIDGRPTIWGDGALALVERSGLLQDMREDYSDDGEEGLTAVCTLRRRSWPTPITRRFSMQMAEVAGLTQKEGPWRTYSRRMLMMRARSWALRDGFADVLRGLSIREEVEDYDAIASPLPEPSAPNSAERRVVSTARPAPRPRFADYLARGTVACARQDSARRRFAGCCPKSILLASHHEPEAAEANANATAGDASIVNVGAGTGAEEGGTDEMNDGIVAGPTTKVQSEEGDTGIATGVGQLAELPAENMSAGTAYGLIDAGGSAIDVECLDALREAFDRLFADRQLSAGQILGLWESNKAARNELERAFGQGALEEADLRRQRAEEQVAQSPLEHGIRAASAGAPSYCVKAEPSSSASGTARQLIVDPSCSDAELFRRYRSQLSALKRRRAKAARFLEFRRANVAFEERLRQRLPDLINEIDAVFAWAAAHAP